MKNTKGKEYMAAISAYILESVTTEETPTGATDKDKINAAFLEFNRVANYPYNLQKFPNDQKRLADFLQGLPFGFEYSWFEIIKLSEKMHECEFTEKEKGTICGGYWMHLANKMMQLHNKLNK